MATKKSASFSQQPPRPGKRLGLKKAGGQKVNSGNIVIRQRGSTFHPGEGMGMGKDYTLYALRDGMVKFRNRLGKKIVSIIPKAKHDAKTNH